MLKAIAGSILGGIVAGAVAIVASAPARNTTPAAPWPAPSEAVGTIDPFGTRAATSEPALVECEPHQRADVRRIVVNGRPVAQVACVSAVQPVVYQSSDIVTPGEVVPVAQAASPAVIRERVVTREPVRRRSSERSWAKSALVIGGGTGAGAGVGGLIGGKKGALIGAAVGGGSAAIFEAVKRK